MPGIKKRSFVSKSYPNSFAAMEWRSLCPVAASGQPEASTAWNRKCHSRWEMPFGSDVSNYWELLVFPTVPSKFRDISEIYSANLSKKDVKFWCHFDAFGLKILGTSQCIPEFSPAENHHFPMIFPMIFPWFPHNFHGHWHHPCAKALLGDDGAASPGRGLKGTWWNSEATNWG